MTTLVRFYCPEHGYLCDAPASAIVLCGRPTTTGPKRRCNRKATKTNPRRAK